MRRPDGLNYRASLRAALGDADEARVAELAIRQERTVDALLARMYGPDDSRREIALLADEVGLGKTFVALGVAWSVLMQRQEAGLAQGPVLVVTPHAHALYNKWGREAERFNSLVAPANGGFEVESVETPHGLGNALRARKPKLVIARMPALSGRLTQRNTSDLALLHWLFHQPGFELDLDARVRLVGTRGGEFSRDGLNLHRSSAALEAAATGWSLGYTESHIAGAWARLLVTDKWLRGRIIEAFKVAREGGMPKEAFWDDLREFGRSAIGQRIPHPLPLVIVDEIHNWKNSPQSWWRFQHMLGGRIERLLGLSATPFQLGPHELVSVLGLRRCLALSKERAAFLDARVIELQGALDTAGTTGARLRDAWAQVAPADEPALAAAWVQEGEGLALPPRLGEAITAARAVRSAHRSLMGSLRAFLVRHRREVSHRAWWVGRESAPEQTAPSARGGAFCWRPGLDVTGDAELVHYLMMRAVQEDTGGRGSTTIGADLGGSYDYFRESVLTDLMPGRTPAATAYVRLVDEATGGKDGHEHPKVAVTAERTFQAWLRGEKTLVFCFNVKTTEAVLNAIRARIEGHENGVLSRALDCAPDAVAQRLKNLQSRLYNYRQAPFLLFQDHPLAGSAGRVPDRLRLTEASLQDIAVRLAQGGPPEERGRFDRRRVLATVEQHLATRWRTSPEGLEWLGGIAAGLRIGVDPAVLSDPGQAQVGCSVAWLADTLAAADWPARRRREIEGLRGQEPEPLPEDAEAAGSGGAVQPADVHAWRALLDSRPGRAVLAPYIDNERLPSLLSTFHSESMARLPAVLRAIAARMLRRMVRSSGFLVRFLLDDPSNRPALEEEGDEADGTWTRVLHERWSSAPTGGESARDRFEAYLEGFRKAAGLGLQIQAFDEATRNLQTAARVTGAVASIERDRQFTGFNTPLMPEVLVVTTVGQEGIDLHRECRHVIHHDLPWNPATLEQRTGRVDRIASKAERLQHQGANSLDVVVPYIAGTYDEHRFRVVQGRAHVFEVTMGADYAVDGHRQVADAMEEGADDDLGKAGVAWASLPAAMAEDLRLRLEAE
jgi:hypothetical protein